MKSILLYLKSTALLILVLIASTVYSQQGINYQGVARDANSELMVNTEISLDINIVEKVVGGTIVYSETNNVMTDMNGVFSTVIGSGTPTLNQFEDINWAEDQHFLNVWMDGIEIGTTEFVSVPYASAMGKWQAHKNGVATKGTGGSIFIGENSGVNATFLNDFPNIGIGDGALENVNGGYLNIAQGFQALNSNTTGHRNIAIGYESLYNNTIGNSNIAVGHLAGSNNINGNKNIFLGWGAGSNETGSEKLYISSTINSFPLIYGDFSDEILGFNANVGIGTKTPAIPLQITSGNDASLNNGSGQILLGLETSSNLVLDANEIQARNNGAASTLFLQQGGGNVYVGGAMVHASDRRLKRDIEDISYGLNSVMQLEPKEYFWKGKTQNYKSLGLIAQEVDEVIKNVVTYNAEEDQYGVSYTELIPVLIKAIQEQEAIIKSLQKDVSELKSAANTKF